MSNWLPNEDAMIMALASEGRTPIQIAMQCEGRSRNEIAKRMEWLRANPTPHEPIEVVEDVVEAPESVQSVAVIKPIEPWNKNLGWTQEQIEIVRKRWIEDGIDCSVIAKELGRTKNSIIGKIQRMGWKGQKARGQIVATPEKPSIPKIFATPSSVKRVGSIGPSGPIIAKNVKALAQAVAPAKPSGGKAMPALASEPRRCEIVELEADQCRFPLDYEESHLFCGIATKPGKPYCDPHMKLTNEPASVARDRRNLRLALASGSGK